MPIRRKNSATEVGKLGDHEVLLQVRTRFLVADLLTTPGAVLLPATSRGRYRLVDAALIANGGAAGGLTSVDITASYLGTRVSIVVALAAGLTQSTVLRAGAANCTVLANGASFVPTDAGTSVNVQRVGSALTGATSIDVLVTYALELASMTSGA